MYIEERPYKGIRKTLIIWLISFMIYNIFIFFYPLFIPPMLISDSNIYFYSYLGIIIGLSIVNFMIYMICTFKLNMSEQERKFLKQFSLYPLLISLFKSLEVINSYIVLINMNLIPFELIITLFAIIQLYKYFKDKRYLYICLVLLLFIIVIVFIKIYSFSNETSMSTTVLNILTLFDDIDLLYDYSLIPIISFGLSVLFMKS